MKKLLFLYTELADYIVGCLRELKSPEIEIHLVRWPIKSEAPFNFNIPEGIFLYERQDFKNDELVSLAKMIMPDLIFSSGWVDKGYVAVCKYFYGKIPTITGMDNHWTGSRRQKVARLTSIFTIRSYFSHMWVPGQPQEVYARKLGFNDSQILQGFYCANTTYFNAIYNNHLSIKKINFPKKFLYVGRYVEFKGIFDLWNAFVELQKEEPNDWELWCLGTGDEWENRMLHPKIKHAGFVQPSEMVNFLRQTGVFILPSHREPWGVVVQEMAAAGFPLVCSNTTGAASKFLEEGRNGFIFEAGDKEALKNQMKKVMEMDQKQLVEMGQHSHDLAQQITPKKWVKEISFLLK